MKAAPLPSSSDRAREPRRDSCAAPTRGAGGAIHHFLERRRQRFIAAFPAQCHEIYEQLDRADKPGFSPRKLRQLASRLAALARTVGYLTVSGRATELERLAVHAGFDTTHAYEIAGLLPEALDVDRAAAGESRPPANSGASDSTAIRVLIVDDHCVLRSGLKALLVDAFRGSTFGEASDAGEAIGQLSASPWDVVLLDLSLPGRSGLDLLRDVNTRWPRLPVLVLSGQPEDQVARRALQAGARGYLTKACAPDELVRAVRKLLDGGRYISVELAEQLALEMRHDPSRPPHQNLSDREYEVMCRLAEGKTVSQIADEMALSVKTISTYRARILEKLSLRTTAEIVHYALRNGLVPC